jgi:hypothetical protein
VPPLVFAYDEIIFAIFCGTNGTASKSNFSDLGVFNNVSISDLEISMFIIQWFVIK